MNVTSQPAKPPLKVPDSGPAQRLHVDVGRCSVQGTRRDHNEDQQFVSRSGDLFIVADGMGGHAAGEVASKFAVDVLAHELATFAVDATRQEIEARVRAALQRAHCLILESAARHPEHYGTGTTVVLGLLVNHRLYITGVGDSRAYLIRDGAIHRLTIDDTWPDTLFHLGQISANQARRHHMRNMLINALGMSSFDSDHEEIRAVDVYDGDRYLLASDGLTDAVGDAELLDVLSEENCPQGIADHLVEHALARGAGDDITCVVFSVRSERQRGVSRAARPGFWKRLVGRFLSTGREARCW